MPPRLMRAMMLYFRELDALERRELPLSVDMRRAVYAAGEPLYATLFSLLLFMLRHTPP